MTPSKFCFVEVDIGCGLTLWLDGNSKITASGGTFDNPHPNALSLPDVATCPSSTPVCRAACYVQGLRVHSPETYAKYVHNERVIHRLLVDPQAYGHSHEALGSWIAEHCNEWRWHVSGDVFSERYAQWIVDVCLDSPDVNHWIYTRSMWAVDTLIEAPNLTVNLSMDRDNAASARQCHATHPNTTRLCYMVTDSDPRHLPMLPNGSVLFMDYPQRGRDLAKPTDHPFWKGMDARERRMTCVADFWGQSKIYRCGVCRRCMDRPRTRTEER